jgi:hypothetical protein
LILLEDLFEPSPQGRVDAERVEDALLERVASRCCG